MGRSRHGIIGPDDPTISYRDNLFAYVGRAISEYLDSFEPWRRQNRYTYVCNNPINRIDPLGLDDIVIVPVPEGNPNSPEYKSEVDMVDHRRWEASQRGPDDTPMKVIEVRSREEAAAKLKNEKGIDSITVDAHGGPGKQRVGSEGSDIEDKDKTITKDTVEEIFGGLDLKENAVIKYEGCEVGQGPKGSALLRETAEVTSRRTEASTGKTATPVQRNPSGEIVYGEKTHEGVKKVAEPGEEPYLDMHDENETKFQFE